MIATGGSSAGYTLYVKDGKVIYDYNFFGKAHYRVVSDNRCRRAKSKSCSTIQQRPFKQFVESTGGPAKLYHQWRAGWRRRNRQRRAWAFFRH